MIDVFFSFSKFQEFEDFFEVIIRDHPEFLDHVVITGDFYRDHLSNKSFLKHEIFKQSF